MKYINIPNSSLKASNVVMGCMRINQLSKSEINKLVMGAIDNGINFFDHADVYGGGECETLFAESVPMSDDLREKVILQGKCGIRKDGKELGGYFDFSKDYILKAVDGILQRLNTDYLDTLLLHRPDTLFEPEEVAEAFNDLHSKGKVKYFGVSNQTPGQIELLQNATEHKILFNQLQLSLAHTPMIDAGMTANMGIDQSIDRTGGILEYSRLHKITIQAWSPFQWGMFKGVFLGDNERFPELNQVITKLAKRYEVPETAIAVAWIARHPANIQVITGTTKLHRLIECCQGSDVPLTKEEWYMLYNAAGNPIP
jgi:predicted oxidoreductase